MSLSLSLRLKLSDFINTDIEQEIMENINSANNELGAIVSLHLWFEEDEISSKDLKEFLMKWEDKLSFKTVIKQSSNIRPNDFVWFDIIPTNEQNSSRKRFSYHYNTRNKILEGLREFYNVTKFTTSEKPVRKQKRNDYED